MEKARLSGQTFLIVQSEIENAIPLQDRIVQDGGRVLTAYSLERALFHATSAPLSGAVIDLGMTGADQIVDLMKSRNVPYIFDSAPGQRRDYTSPADLHSSASGHQSA